MNKLFKSKFLLGILMVVAFAAFSNVAVAYTHSGLLKLKSTGSQVMSLQQALNSNGFLVSTTGAGSPGSESSYFGSKTKSAVMAFQSAKGLVSDGIVGTNTGTALEAMTGTSMTYPAGCTSNVGYSSTTGMSCASSTTTTLPAGCITTAGFSPLTGVSCSTGMPTMTYPAGCTGPTGFSATTGQACSATTTTGPVGAMIATTNPASGTLVAGQATADLAHFTFNGTGTVTTVTLQRLGVSADSTPSNVYLFDGATRLTDAASVANNGTVTFNVPAGIFMVNGSKTISVKSDIATGTSGQTLGFQLATFATSAGTVTANLSGNIHTIASATLAAVSGGTETPDGATLNPGPNVTVWQNTLTISQRDVWMKRLALRNVGSAPAASFQNFKLFVNGVQVGTATGVDINGYVTFDLMANPVLLASGSRVVRVDADIVSGASRTVNFSLRNAADVDFVDSSFGVNIAPTGTPWGPTSNNTISGTGGGTLTIEKDPSSPTTNVTLSGNDVNLATFKATAYGESIKIETLTGGFTFTDGGAANAAATLRNGRMLISTDGVNWVQYGSTATLLAAGTSFTLNYTVMPGTPVWIQLHADIFDNDGTGSLDSSDTILGKLIAGSSNAQRIDSLGSFSTSAVSANTLALTSASITLSKNATYANQTTALPSTNFKVGSWNLNGSSVEDVLLTTLSFDVDEVDITGGDFDENDMTNMYVVVKNSAGTIVSQPSPVATVAAADNNFSVNYTLVKNTNVTIELFANLADAGTAAIAPNSFKTDLTITGTALVSGSAVTATSADTDGQTIIFGAASITVSKDASSPVTGIVYDNQTVTTLAAKFAAVTAGYNLTDLTVTLGANANTIVQSVMLYDGATLIAQGPMTTATTAVFNGITWNIPANTNKVLTVKVQLGSIGVGAGTSGAVLTTSIAAATDAVYTNTSTGVSTSSTTEEAGTATGSAMYAYAAIPVITQETLASTSLLNTVARPLIRFTMNGSGGDIAWGMLTFKVNKDDATTVGTDATTGITLWDVTNGANASVSGTFTNGAQVFGATTTCATVTCDIKFVPGTEQVVSGSKTYELRGNIAGSVAAGDYVTVTLDNDSSAVVALDSVADLITADPDAPFIWSDMSASSHTTTTDDWTTDFGVKNLPVAGTMTSPL